MTLPWQKMCTNPREKDNEINGVTGANPGSVAGWARTYHWHMLQPKIIYKADKDTPGWKPFHCWYFFGPVIIFSLLHQLSKMEGPGCISRTWIIRGLVYQDAKSSHMEGSQPSHRPLPLQMPRMPWKGACIARCVNLWEWWAERLQLGQWRDLLQQ